MKIAFLPRIFIVLLFSISFTDHSFANDVCRETRTITYPKERFFILGETHGTNESQAATLELICHLRSQYKRVFVGLEIPNDEAKLLGLLGVIPDQQLAVDLQASYFWSRDFQDGRSSQAMFDLVKALNKMNGNISLFAFASSEEQAKKGLSRTEAMMENTRISLADYSENDAVVILAGNYHAQKRNDEEDISFAQELSKEFTVTSIKLSYEHGVAWNCYPGEDKPIVCGARKLRDNRILVSNDMTSMSVFRAPQDGFDGEIVLQSVSASLPLKANW